jgi:flavodoxin
MKRITIHIALLTVGLSILSSCSKAQNTTDNVKEKQIDTILIVYLTRTANTKAVAQIIQKNIGGTLVELELKNPYPENYKANVDQVVKENETGFLPPLKTKIDNIEKYKLVFIGFPTWDMQVPPPIKSFLKQYDLSGKIIIPFNTNAGYGVGSGFQTVEDLCPDSKVLKGYETEGGKEKEGILLAIEGKKKEEEEQKIKQWLQTIKILK